ncbi:transglycosylase domain-containing protein [Streptomyces iconiensis]|uniref:Transglycosylase domain-containing protein n=1 Tax=Streptomyces iconiensis TaxID=1384038 RepID=A0ABT6ZT86_9ACTN|nr:transglycosylase domain-containing protein [Streptomyces iconiensis]MDJ1131668.1 transglycosylase domain-containing protein [Streptomyces iconiensis]
MSGNRRKPPQGRGRRAAQPQPQPSSGRRGAESRGASPSAYGSRAEARKATQGGGRRRAATAHGQTGRRGGEPAPEHKRFINYPRSGKRGVRRWLPSWKLVTGSCLSFIGLLIVAFAIGLWMVEVPNQAKAEARSQTNVYYWANGDRLAVAGAEGEKNRQNVSLDQMPTALQDAVIASENSSFWDDSGVDPMGIARAGFNMATGGDTQGGSTITQQFVKNNYLSQDQTVKRKMTELFISIKAGATMDKQDILEGYLNTAYFGRGAFGVQAASQAYFGKDVHKINASESAYLTTLLNGAALYDPYEGDRKANEARSLKKWRSVLHREAEVGKMSRSKANEIIKKGPPTVKPPKKAMDKRGQKGYLIDLANRYLVNNNVLSREQLNRGGFQITTTFDKKKTFAMRDSVNDVYKKNIDPKKRPNLDTHVQFGGASVNPNDGKIVALYGGEDFVKHFTNNADDAGVPVGSTFKPFVLASAMRDGVRDRSGGETQSADERSLVNPDSSYYDGRNKLLIRNYNGTIWKNREGKFWRQTNDGHEDYGDPANNYRINLREAMVKSVNSPYVQLGMDIGIPTVRKAAEDAGLLNSSLNKSNSPSFSLGTSTPSAIRMAGAYGTFAAQGERNDLYSVTKVIDQDGKKLTLPDRHRENKFSPQVANNVTDVLTDVVDRGTGTVAKGLGRPVAGKTGTTDGNKSAWFVGYTPQLSTAVGMWRLNDDAKVKNRKFLEMFGTGGQEKIHGASFPATIWTSYMREALEGTKIRQFPDAQPIGDKVFGPGASPKPTPTEPSTPPPPKETEDPSDKPSDKPSESPPDKPSDSPSDDCPPLDPKCHDEGQDGGSGEPPNGGNGNGGPGGGDPGGDTEGPGGDPGGGDPGNIFAGQTGGNRRD